MKKMRIPLEGFPDEMIDIRDPEIYLKPHKKMKSIYKYELLLADTQNLELPKNSGVLSFQFQQGVPTLWVLVTDPKTAPKVTHEVKLIPTGAEMEDAYLDGFKYVGTTQNTTQDFVLHAFIK